jgi:hypothetical protein
LINLKSDCGSGTASRLEAVGSIQGCSLYSTRIFCSLRMRCALGESVQRQCKKSAISVDRYPNNGSENVYCDPGQCSPWTRCCGRPGHCSSARHRRFSQRRLGNRPMDRRTSEPSTTRMRSKLTIPSPNPRLNQPHRGSGFQPKARSVPQFQICDRGAARAAFCVTHANQTHSTCPSKTSTSATLQTMIVLLTSANGSIAPALALSHRPYPQTIPAIPAIA